jgi:hypothetical protein
VRTSLLTASPLPLLLLLLSCRFWVVVLPLLSPRLPLLLAPTLLLLVLPALLVSNPWLLLPRAATWLQDKRVEE